MYATQPMLKQLRNFILIVFMAGFSVVGYAADWVSPNKSHPSSNDPNWWTKPHRTIRDNAGLRPILPSITGTNWDSPHAPVGYGGSLTPFSPTTTGTTGNAFAATAPTLSLFYLEGITSEGLNPQPWSTPYDLYWDILGPYELSGHVHQFGGWIAFATRTLGYYSYIGASYNGQPLTWYSTDALVDSTGTVVGWRDFWYCVGCTSGSRFTATAYGINSGPVLNSSVYVP